MLVVNIYMMVTGLKIPGKKKKILLKHFGKAMQILVLKRTLKKARVNVPEIDNQP